MRALLAATLIASSCAPARMPGGNAAAVPDAGAAAPDAGMAAPDAGPAAPDAGAGMWGTMPPTPGVRQVDPYAPYPGVAPPALLDRDAKTLLAVSPDGRYAVVSNDVLRNCTSNPHSGPPCDPSYDIPLRLVTADVGSVALGFGGRSADFSGDGRFLFVGGLVSHADGKGFRPNPPFQSVGRWLYSWRSGELFRQRDLDDDPSLVIGGTDGAGGLALSPDGESIAYCRSSGGDCFLQSPIGSPPMAIASGTLMWWEPEGKWLFVWPCTFVDPAGTAASVCDSIAPGTSAQRVGDTIAYVSAVSSGFDVDVRNAVTSTEVVFPAAPGAKGVWLSPDGRKLLSGIAESTDPASTATVLEAPSSGGPWTTLASHTQGWSMSEDSRFVGFPRMGSQPLISVDGAPAFEVGVPGLDLSGALGPDFEPKGGFGKAIFFEWDPGRMGLHSVIGNADGSGDWLRLPNGAPCEWRGHTALCFNLDFYAVRGDQAGLLAGAALPQGPKGYMVAPSAGRIFFVANPAGLWSVELPGP